MPRGWGGRGRGIGWGGWGWGPNPYPFCRRFPWLPRGWWAFPYYGMYYGFYSAPYGGFYPYGPMNWYYYMYSLLNPFSMYTPSTYGYRGYGSYY